MAKSYFLFALNAITLLLVAVFAGRVSADLHFKDTYCVLPLRNVFNILAGFSGLVFLVCFILERWLRLNWLGLIHSAGSILLLAVIVILLYQSVYRPNNFDPQAVNGIIVRSEWLVRLGYALLAWQILIPLNWILSATRQ